MKKHSEIDSIALSNHKIENHDIDSQIKSKSNNSEFIKLIDSKKEMRENDGNFNQMTLFEINKDISLDQLKKYCISVKPNYANGYFQILVFFKEPNVARFPDNTVTGMYLEENDLKNIKAVYTINNINGYSKLDYYDKNNWESLAQTVDIN